MTGIISGALGAALVVWFVARPIVRAVVASERRSKLRSALLNEVIWLKMEAPGVVLRSESPVSNDFACLCHYLDRASKAVSDERDEYAAQLMMEARDRLLRLRDSEIGKRYPQFALSLENTRIGDLSKRVMALAANPKGNARARIEGA